MRENKTMKSTSRNSNIKEMLSLAIFLPLVCVSAAFISIRSMKTTKLLNSIVRTYKIAQRE